MTRAELVEQLSKRVDITQKMADLVVETFYTAIVDSLQNGGKVELRGFGSFRIREYEGYIGRNPRTGAAVQVPPKRAPFFKAGKELREAVNHAGGSAGRPSERDVWPPSI